MKIYSKYLVKQLTLSIFTYFLILLVIFSLLKLIGEVGKIGTNNYGFIEAFIFIVLYSPLFVKSIGPLSVLLGIYSSLGSMNSLRYLQILQTGQISHRELLFKFTRIGFAAMLFFFIFSEFASPFADSWSEYYRKMATDGKVSLVRTGENMWFKDEEKFIFLGKKEKSNVFHNIQVIDPDKKNGVITFIYADRGSIEDKTLYASEAKIFTANINKANYSITQKTEITSATELVASTDLIENMNAKPDKLSFISLIEKLIFSAEGENTSKFSIEVFSRIFQPIFLLMAIFFTIPKFFSNSRSFSTGKAIFAAIFVGLIINIINRFIVISAMRWEFDLYTYTSIFIIFVLSFGYSYIKKIQ